MCVSRTGCNTTKANWLGSNLPTENRGEKYNCIFDLFYCTLYSGKTLKDAYCKIFCREPVDMSACSLWTKGWVRTQELPPVQPTVGIKCTRYFRDGKHTHFNIWPSVGLTEALLVHEHPAKSSWGLLCGGEGSVREYGGNVSFRSNHNTTCYQEGL